ncbi:hypothetical protein INT47_002909 [Mucor saturninus]|uniref:Uncharacterized protein n=1 Tax=Mucor saturninus TaxID=64648 RepID=A0A8H7QP23_9FUNG|nr:hypothetical protein INT47_002909 [Mucor saturninus]
MTDNPTNNLPESRFWSNLMRSVESAASSLELFEGLALVDESLSSINKLITLGQTLEEVKEYGSAQTQEAVLHSFQTAHRESFKHLAESPPCDTKDKKDSSSSQIHHHFEAAHPLDSSSSSQFLPRQKFSSIEPIPQIQYERKSAIKDWETELQKGIYWDIPEESRDKPFEEEEEYEAYDPPHCNRDADSLDNDDVWQITSVHQPVVPSHQTINTNLPSDDSLLLTYTLGNILHPSDRVIVPINDHLRNKFRVAATSSQCNVSPYANLNTNDHEEEVTAWSEEEAYFDTMQIPVRNLPVLAYAGGPRLINPNDDEIYSDGSGEDEETKVQSKLSTSRIKDVESLPSFVDSIALYTNDQGPSELLVFYLDKPQLMNSVNLPALGSDFVVVICYHISFSQGRTVLKGLQAYISTGESYTMHVQNVLFGSENSKEKFKESKFGQLLTDPKIKRVCWRPDHIQNQCKEKLGVYMGPCIDLLKRVGGDKTRFHDAFEMYLKDWDVKPRFEEAKGEYEASLTSKLNKLKPLGWDLLKLPQAVLNFSALHGLATYTLYQKSLKNVEINDDDITCFPPSSDI